MARHKTLKVVVSSAAAAAATLLAGHAARASTASWTSSSGANYNTAANWTGATGGNGVLPGVNDVADILSGGVVGINSATGTINIASMYAGDTAGYGEVDQSAGNLNLSQFLVVGHSGSAGTFNFSGGTLNENGATTGSYVRVFGSAATGVSSAVFNMSDSTGTNTGTVLNDAGIFDVGYNSYAGKVGAGTFNLSAGTINMTNTASAFGSFAIGDGNGTTGIFNMAGGILNLSNTQMWIGCGTSNSSNASSAPGGTGVFNLSVGTVTSNSWVAIGRGGAAGSNSGAVTSNQGYNSNGLLNLTGGTFTHLATASGDFQVGSQGAGINATLNLAGTSTLVTNHITDESTPIAGYSQVINFNGGTLQANASDQNYIRSFNSSDAVPTLNIGSGGLNLNTAGFNIGIQLPLVHGVASGSDGGVNVYGGGNFNLSNSSTYTNATTVSGTGTVLNLLGSLTSSLTVQSGGGVGSSNAAGGTTSGSTTGSLTFNGLSNLDVNATGSQFLTIGGSANASTASVTVVPVVATTTTTPEEILYAKGGIYGTLGSPGSGANFVPGVRGSLSVVSDSSGVGQDLLLTPASAGAANLIWNGSTGNPTLWDVQTTANWYNTGTAGLDQFYQKDNVTFDDTAASFTVALQTAVSPTSVTFNNTAHQYQITGPGSIAGSTGITVAGGGTVYMTASNTYTGPTLIQSGTVQVGVGGNLGNTSGISLGNSAASGMLVLGDSNGPVTLTIPALNTSGSGTSNMVVGGNAGVSTLIVSVASGVTDSYGGLLGGGAGASSTANSLMLTKSGSGTLQLSGSNTYTGGTNLSGGTLNITNNSALGPGALTAVGVATAGSGTAKTATSGTLQPGANVSLANNINIGTGSLAIGTNGYNITLTGNVTNTQTTAQVLQVQGAGTLNLAGTFSLAGGTNDTNNPAMLMTANGTTVNITGTGTMSAISTAWYNTSNTLMLNPAGTLNLTNTDSTLDVGQGNNASAGLVLQTGGVVNMSAGNLSLAKWDGSYGMYNMTGGTLNVSAILSSGNGGGSGNSLFVQNGGVVNAGRTTIGQGGAGNSTAYLTAGSYNNSGTILLGNGAGSAASLTVTGTASLNTSSIALAGNANASGVSVVNLDGGVATTNGIYAAGTNATSLLNFNGGTLRAQSPGDSLVAGLTAAVIYSGGAVIDTGSNNVLLSQNISSANASSGLNSAPTISSAGSGYLSNPVVTVVGGGGTGATAIATITNRQVSGITITNPGTNYTSAPTFNISGGGGTGASVTAPAPTANAQDGGLIKVGSGSLTLSGTNTYNGNTQIQAGTLVVGNNNALGNSAAVISNHATLALGTASSSVIQFNGINAVYDNQSGVFAPFPFNGGNSVQMTTNKNSVSTAVWLEQPVTIDDGSGFTASFTYTHQNVGPLLSAADGLTFTLQSEGTGAEGGSGGSLGYSGTGLAQSVAMGLDLYNDDAVAGFGNGTKASFQTPTGVTTTLYGPNNLVIPQNNPTGSNTVPIISQSGSVQVTITYAYNASTGGQLTESLTSLANGSTYTYVVDGIDLAQYFTNFGYGAGNDSSGLPEGQAYIGFTGATGSVNDVQTISNFSFSNTSNGVAYSPVSISNAVSVVNGSTGVLQLSPAANYSYGKVGAITIGSGGVLSVSLGSNVSAGVSRGLLVTPSVTLSNSSSGQLDIAQNALDLTGQSLADVNSLVKAGYAGGAWNGPGIISSTAAADATHLTTLGVAQNNLLPTPFTTFNGAAVGANDVLVKYTYYGDANLDGSVNSADYALIDAGYLSNGSLTGWQNGDFNYDGLVNGSDYTLIDNAFNVQGASLATEVSNQIASATAQIAGGVTAAVPEPASLGLLAMGGVALLGRRRRR